VIPQIRSALSRGRHDVAEQHGEGAAQQNEAGEDRLSRCQRRDSCRQRDDSNAREGEGAVIDEQASERAYGAETGLAGWAWSERIEQFSKRQAWKFCY
jgi:hypothetical protein